MHRSTLLAFPAMLSLAFATASAQVSAPATDYAITNVRIVTAPGNVIDRGTVVVRGGKIAAVGASVAVPSGVTTMDGAGQTVFPGLIDAATSIGLLSANRATPADSAAAAAAAGAGGRGRGGAGTQGRGTPPPNPNAPPYRGVLPYGVPADSLPQRSHPMSPQIDAATEAASVFAPTPDQLRNLRTGGVTTVGLVFQGGTFPGRVGAASTGGPNESQLSMRSGVAQQVAFGTLRGGYPGTGIGAYAYVRQAILDAQYEGRVENANKAGNASVHSSNDPFLKALIPAGRNEIPTWFVASTERQINLTADVVKEMGLKNAAFIGSQEGWRVIPAFKASGATAIVSLNWPSPSQVTGATFTDMSIGAGGRGGGGGAGGGGGRAGAAAAAAGPGSPEIRANAAALSKAGVPVVLASFGGASGSDFRDRIRSTIEAGMSSDDALRATTVTPAALLGISAQVGTIEVGKLANLVMVNGNDLFAAGSPITHVFVQGRLY